MDFGFGRALREALFDHGKTQGGLARAMGYSPAYVSDVIAGKRQPFAPAALNKVCSWLDADPAERQDLFELAVQERGGALLVLESWRNGLDIPAAALLASLWETLDETKLERLSKLVESWR